MPLSWNFLGPGSFLFLLIYQVRRRPQGQGHLWERGRAKNGSSLGEGPVECLIAQPSPCPPCRLRSGNRQPGEQRHALIWRGGEKRRLSAGVETKSAKQLRRKCLLAATGAGAPQFSTGHTWRSEEEFVGVVRDATCFQS